MNKHQKHNNDNKNNINDHITTRRKKRKTKDMWLSTTVRNDLKSSLKCVWIKEKIKLETEEIFITKIWKIID